MKLSILTLSFLFSATAFAHSPAYPSVEINVTSSAALPASFCVEQIQPPQTEGYSFNDDENDPRSNESIATFLSIWGTYSDSATRTITIPLVIRSANKPDSIIERRVTAVVTKIGDPNSIGLQLASLIGGISPEIDQAFWGIPNTILGGLHDVLQLWGQSRVHISSLRAIRSGDVTEDAVNSTMSAIADADMLMMSVYACPDSKYLQQSRAISGYFYSFNSAISTLEQSTAPAQLKRH